MKHILPRGWREGVIHVDLVGVGGTGSQVLSGLARLHLALRALGGYGLEVRAFDPDTISEANIGRQLFSPSDIGLYKADILIHRLNVYYGLNWKSFPCRYGEEAERFAESRGDAVIGSLVITCVDSAAARRNIWTWLMRHTGRYRDNYWLDMGNSRQSGQVFLSQLPGSARRGIPTDGRLPSLEFWLPEIFDESVPEDDTPSCSLAEALESQDLFVNQMVATWGMHLLWIFIREGGLDICGYWISLESGMVAPVPVPVPSAPGKPQRGRKAGSNG
jgi:PRTRC genetic system ThiF family protein